MTFKEAFAAARKKHGANGTFTWNGKKYHTKYKEEVAAEKEKRKSSPKPKLRPEPKKKDSPDAKDPRKSEYKSGAGKTKAKTKVTTTNKSSEPPKTKKKGTPSKRLDTKGKTPPKSTSKSDSGAKSGRVKHKIQTTTKQPKSDIVASSTPSRSRQDSKAATSGNTRVTPSRPSNTPGVDFKPYISQRAVETTKAHEKAKKERNKVSPGMDFNTWYKANGSKYKTTKEAMEAWRKSKKTNMSKGGMVRSGSTDRRKGMFYKTGSPNKYK